MNERTDLVVIDLDKIVAILSDRLALILGEKTKAFIADNDDVTLRQHAEGEVADEKKTMLVGPQEKLEAFYQELDSIFVDIQKKLGMEEKEDEQSKDETV